jgi:hypothetical protein
MIVRIDIHHAETSGYDYSVSAEGQELYGDTGLSSILHCLAGAIEGLGPEVHAAELALGGIVSGTYPLPVMATRPAEIAQHAVNTTNAVREADPDGDPDADGEHGRDDDDGDSD